MGLVFQEATPVGDMNITVNDLTGDSLKFTAGGYGPAGFEVVGNSNEWYQDPTYESIGIQLGAGLPGIEATGELETTHDISDAGPGQEPHLYGSGIVIPGL